MEIKKKRGAFNAPRSLLENTQNIAQPKNLRNDLRNAFPGKIWAF